MGVERLRAAGDRDLAAILLEDHAIREAIDVVFKDRLDDTRRHLLAIALDADPTVIDRAQVSGEAELD